MNERTVRAVICAFSSAGIEKLLDDNREAPLPLRIFMRSYQALHDIVGRSHQPSKGFYKKLRDDIAVSLVGEYEGIEIPEKPADRREFVDKFLAANPKFREYVY